MMHTPRNRIFSAIVAAWLAACAQSAPDPTAAVTIAGPHSVLVGDTIELVATTANGDDSGYDWSSSDSAIASVSEEGVVSASAPGEAVISAVGQTSGKQASHVVVVIDPMQPGVHPSSVPFLQAWNSSPHSDATSPAFNYWNDDGEVPVACARCHSSAGFIDYLGGNNTTFGSVQHPAPTGSVIGCDTCHHSAAQALSSVTFPSGHTVAGLGAEARCMTCHQGRASGIAVDERIASAEVSDDDEVSSDLSFLNIHYYPTAATLYAGQAHGGYQYAGETYDTRFRHVPGFDSCTGCHDGHSTRVRFDECVTCHPNATDIQGARDIRMIASFNQDYDGDGNSSEGIYYEITTLVDTLFTSISRYGSERGQPICYNSSTFPYWFKDSDGDKVCNESESTFANRYDAWTARLMRATYNVQMASKDKGAFAHNAKYIIQLLHDSIQDMNSALTASLDVSKLVRTDTGHFDGAGRAARNWDQAGEVNPNCSRCHSGASGFRFFLTYGVGGQQLESANGLECNTCHVNFGDTYDLLAVASTTFPGGAKIALKDEDNLCGTCHSGRESMATIDQALASGHPLSFRNVHYGPAAGVLMGSEAKVGYEFAGKDYAASLQHFGGRRCTTCHDAVASNHTFRVEDAWEARCDGCHGDFDNAREVRMPPAAGTEHPDYDGDGNNEETLADEIDGMAQKLLTAMHQNSTPKLCYSKTRHPYFFVGTAPLCTSEEAVPANRFNAWTEDLVRAAHNYQLSRMDGGAWMHNFKYIGQLLFDSVEVLTDDNQNMIRP